METVALGLKVPSVSYSSASASEEAKRLAKACSRGMQRRLDAVLGLTHRPTGLFLDGPTTALDPEAGAELWHEIDTR